MHVGENQTGACVPQPGFHAGSTMCAASEPEGAHSSRARPLNPCNAVLNHQTRGRRETHELCRVEKDVRCRFAARDHIGTEQVLRKVEV